MRYYISDLHFFHDALNTKMDMRGFENIESMHTYMINKWNKKVRKNDEVVILGDFSLGTGKETNRILESLQGRLYMITGNHDKFLKNRTFNSSRFEWIEPYKELHDDGRKVVLCHYPVFCYNGQYRRDKDGNPKTYMLYGHVHNTYDELLVHSFLQQTREHTRKTFGMEKPKNIPCQMINCFCMFSDYEPLSLDEWIALDAKRRESLNNPLD